jgi:peptidoglycan LD-endopeptidase CwlK
MRNNHPQEIVALFEKQGLIWGGKWSHFDLMHGKYRPEMLKKWQLVRGAGSGG